VTRSEPRDVIVADVRYRRPYGTSAQRFGFDYFVINSRPVKASKTIHNTAGSSLDFGRYPMEQEHRIKTDPAAKEEAMKKNPVLGPLPKWMLLSFAIFLSDFGLYAGWLHVCVPIRVP